MENGKAIITSEINATLLDLQRSDGATDMYLLAIRRIFSIILRQQDELDLNDTEAVSILRVLDMLRQDLVTLSQRADNMDILDEVEEPKE